MIKMFAGALAIAGAVVLASPAPVSAAPSVDGIKNGVQVDLSAARRKKRYVRRYEAPRYYGYYGPTSYDRPYNRPRSPWFFWPGGYW